MRHLTARSAACVAAALLGLLAVALVLDRAFPPDFSRLRAVGSEVLDGRGRLLALRPAPGGVWRLRTTASDVSPVFLQTLLAIEDRGFWHHPGVDPGALLRAAVQDLAAGRVVSGGSTLAMQAARLLHPHRRTLLGKAVEILRALQLEAHLSRREVLGIWLTLAPFGGNIEGVTAASYAWFGIPPGALDAEQSALLVAIPRRPEALRPDRHPAAARAVRDRILAAAGAPGTSVVPGGRRAMPSAGGPLLAGLPGGERVATTLDLPLQTALERFAAARLPGLPTHAALAILVADAATRAIRAAVAGEGVGSLDLTRRPRSPGSALKPFIYGMAFQDGIADPATPLADLPRRFGAYAPEDFDRGFSGSVSAAEALQRSLNLPAVGLLDRIGPLRFLASLRAAGIALQLPRGAAPSLPLALGGAGVSMRDLAALYAALATDGAVVPLTLQPAPAVAGVPLFGARVTQQVAAVLTRPLPDGGPEGVAWKTGTSWGGRDAWACGFDARHVVVVWVGRPDGTPMPGATGVGTALPLLGQVLALLPPAPRPTPAPVVAGASAAEAADALRLLFPPPGAVLSGDGPITLRAMGGRRPLSFLIDGVPIAGQAARRDADWQPPSAGFYALTVLDADGQAAHATVRVR